jgi:hypothetical protein
MGWQEAPGPDGRDNSLKERRLMAHADPAWPDTPVASRRHMLNTQRSSENCIDSNNLINNTRSCKKNLFISI